ncbi:MAG: DUF4412 domain-containing protein [candidate division Zixibacteria bacterium]|nr:DUF4412 domain-containing protein [candidate division Zixibacteria bacterium]
MRKLTFYSVLLLAAVAFTAANALGGYILKNVSEENSSVMGAANKGKTNTTIYYEDGMLKTVEEGSREVTIIDLNKNILYNINHGKKTYSQIDLAELQAKAGAMKKHAEKQMEDAMARMENMPPEQQEMMKQMMGTMNAKFKVQKTSETKDILGYKCTKYVMTRGNMLKIDMWVTDDLDVGDSYQKFMQFMMAHESDEGMFDELKKIDGVALETESYINMGPSNVRNRDYTKEIKETNIDDSEFKVPEGYKKEEFSLENAG